MASEPKPEAMELLAMMMAEMINGGSWWPNYAEAQKEGWRRKARFCFDFASSETEAKQAVIEALGLAASRLEAAATKLAALGAIHDADEVIEWQKEAQAIHVTYGGASPQA